MNARRAVFSLFLLSQLCGCYFLHGYGGLKRGCDAGEVSSCQVAAMYTTLDAFPVIITNEDRRGFNLTAARGLQAKDCDPAKVATEGGPFYCAQNAALFFVWGALDPEGAKAIEKSRELCSLYGEAKACMVVGTAHWYGYGVDEDRDEAARLFAAAGGCKTTDESGAAVLRPGAECALMLKPRALPVPTDEERLARARELLAKGEASRANPILRSLKQPPTDEELVAAATELLGTSARAAAEAKFVEVKRLLSAGRPTDAMALLRSFEGQDWPAEFLAEAARQRDQLADEQWESAVAPEAAKKHYYAALAKAAGLARQLPEDHPIAQRVKQLVADGTGFHWAASFRQTDAGRALSAALHERLALRLGAKEPTFFAGPIHLGDHLLPTLPKGSDCAWLGSAMAVVPELSGGAALSLAGELVCETGEKERKWEQHLEWIEQVASAKWVWVEEPQTVIESYSCQQMNPCTGPNCMTSYRTASCMREVKKNVRVQKLETTYSPEPRRGVAAHHERTGFARVRGRVKPAEGGAPWVAIAIDEHLTEEGIRSPREDASRALGFSKLTELQQAAAEKVAKALQPTLAAVAAAQAQAALEALQRAAQGGDADADTGDEAALTALLRGSASPEPAGWLEKRLGLSADQVRQFFAGTILPPGG